LKVLFLIITIIKGKVITTNKYLRNSIAIGAIVSTRSFVRTAGKLKHIAAMKTINIGDFNFDIEFLGF